MAEQSSYPIILIPDSIRSAKSELPDLPEFTLMQPKAPGPRPEILNKRVVATQNTIAVIPGALVVSLPKARMAGVGLLAATLIAIAIRTGRRVALNQKSKAEHQQYHNEMAIYQEESRHHQLEREEAIAAFQLKLILKVLDQALPPDGSNSRARRGWSEPNFQEYLEHFFPEKIHTGETIYRNETKQFPYTPDFIYVDPAIGLHVDIEIDEPYAYLNRKPTHYIGHEKDETQNQAILSREWIIVRFSEEQVIRWPESCCKTIAEAIAEVVGSEILKPFTQVKDLPTQSRWTEEGAIAMAEQATRQDYMTVA